MVRDDYQHDTTLQDTQICHSLPKLRGTLGVPPHNSFQLSDPDLPPAASASPPAVLGRLLPSAASLSRKSDQSSARPSLLARCSMSDEEESFSVGVLGVFRNGEMGTRSDEAMDDDDPPPGLARPACSFCSSSQANRAAMSCSTWNFLGSDRSNVKKCRKWFVTTCLYHGG
jgi:hypothetical protein